MIYFVRHGQTDWNKIGRIQGHTDIPLNKLGEEQALIVKEKLKEIKFDKVFSSPLKRALQWWSWRQNKGRDKSFSKF